MASKSFLTVVGSAVLVLGAVLMAGGFLTHARGEDLPDFSQWPAGDARKDQFFEFLRPLFERENRTILEERRRLVAIEAAYADAHKLSRRERRDLRKLAEAYYLDPAAMSDAELIDELLLRVDTVPASLGMAQAAKESAWGTSRFAAAGNALFGQRCFDEGCGIIPEFRAPGETYQVRSFDTPADAVASYVRNLNTHSAHEQMRHLRAQIRDSGRPPTGFELAQTLESYSERGDAYVREVQEMIRYNRLGAALPATTAQER